MAKKANAATERNQKMFLESLGVHQFNITKACEATGVGRRTHYQWLKEYPEYKAAFESIPELELDFVEGKLFELINGVTLGKTDANGELKIYDQPPCKTSIIFYLKTKGKKRGYIEGAQLSEDGERSEIKLPNGTIITI
jgi:hypothetical protein